MNGSCWDLGKIETAIDDGKAAAPRVDLNAKINYISPY
jgi:hypothetical protein